MENTEGHAFISYVREDAPRVERLQKILEAAGVRVWRDTADLWPGEDWRMNIRRAITRDALVFIACFSENSERRSTSGQNAELMLAVDQLRLRRPDQPWLIPVRLDDVSVPDLDIGGGRTLDSIQRADLLGDTWEEGSARLVAAVVRALKVQDVPSLPAPAVSIQEQLKQALRDPAGDIALNDLLLPLANEVHGLVSSDQLIPTTSESLRGSVEESALYVADLAETYVQAMSPAVDALIPTAQWVLPEQTPILTRFVERLAPAVGPRSGMVVLLDLRWVSVLPVLYAGGLAALHRSNFAALRAITLDAHVRDEVDGRVQLIGRGSPWRPFVHLDLVPQVMAFRAAGQEVSRQVVEELNNGRRGKRYTPVSDYLHDTLREKFRAEIPDDADYSDLFDKLEVFLALIALDLQAHQRESSRVYLDGPYFGRHRWRSRNRSQEGPEADLARQLLEQGENWPPLRAGLFGGSVDRADEAIQAFSEGAKEARRRTF